MPSFSHLYQKLLTVSKLFLQTVRKLLLSWGDVWPFELWSQQTTRTREEATHPKDELACQLNIYISASLFSNSKIEEGKRLGGRVIDLKAFSFPSSASLLHSCLAASAAYQRFHNQHHASTLAEASAPPTSTNSTLYLQLSASILWSTQTEIIGNWLQIAFWWEVESASSSFRSGPQAEAGNHFG